MYRIRFHPSAARDLQKLDPQIRRRVGRALDRLAADPRGGPTAKLRGADDLWRLRVGDHHVIFQLLDQVLIVLVLRVRHRRDAYR